MARPYPPDRFLSGNFAPLRAECDAPERGASDFLVFDAQAIADGPLATARLDVRVPNGFHAAWRSFAT